MENFNEELLKQKYEIFFNKAKKYELEKDYEQAKKCYLLACQNMLQLAKVSTPAVQKVRMEKAKYCKDKADNIIINNVKKVVDVPKVVVNNKPTKQSDENDSEEGKIWQKAEIPNIRFSDIAGLEDVKETIRVRMIYPLRHRDLYDLYKKQTGGGVLLFGPPGTGKTMIAKAIACEVGASFYAVKGSDIVSKWVGESEKNISSLFETARKDDLAIIFIDEVDTLLAKRGDDVHNDKRVNEFLQQMDGFVGKNPNLLLLGATNRPWDIDSAIMRSGRFSEKIYVELPDFKARKFMFDKCLKDIPIEDDVDTSYFAEISEGLSGADITEICDRAKVVPLLQSVTMQERGNSDFVLKLSKAHIMEKFSQIRSSCSKEELKKFEEFGREFGIPVSNNFNSSKMNRVNDFDDLDILPPKFPKASDLEREERPNNINNFGGNYDNSRSNFNNQQNSNIQNNINDKLEILLASNTIKLLPNEKPKLEFYLSKDFDSIYIKLNSHNYMCKKNIRNWSTDGLDIEAGKYKVEVFAINKIGEFEVSFVKGMEENDDFDF